MRTLLCKSIAAVFVLTVLFGAIGCGGDATRSADRSGQRLASVSVRDFGAVGDGRTNDSAAIRAAIARVAQKGSGTVVFPAGDYLTGPIQLVSHMTLQLERGATIRFSTNPADYPLTLTRWEATECYNFSPLVHGRDLTDVTISGAGTIDGQGKAWWDMRRTSRPAVARLRKMGQDGTPVDDRRFGTVEDGLRPPLVEFWQCSNVTVEGVTLQQSPFWTVHPVYCTDVTLRNLTIRGDGPNTDGIDPDSCQRVRIDNCDIATGDDCIAIKSGRDSDGRRVNRPSRDIQISNCRFTAGHAGVAIGSETSSGVSDVVIRNCIADGTNVGILIKTMRGRGGAIENITADGITLKNVKRDGVMVTMRYNPSEPEPVSERTPAVSNVTFRDIKGTSLSRAGRIVGLEERAVANVRLENIQVVAKEGFAVAWADQTTFAVVSLKLDKGPAIECADSSALIVNGLALKRPISASPVIRLADVRGFALRNATPPAGTSVVARATGTVTDMNVGGAKVVRDPDRDPLEITAATQPYGGTSADRPTASVGGQQ